MKKLLIFLVLLLVVGFGIYHWTSKKTVAPVTPVSNDTSFKPDPSNATFTFDDGPVTLSQGKNITADSQSGMETDTQLIDKQVSGDLNGDGKQDTAVFIEQSGGGSGTFIYVGAYVSGNVNYKGTNAVFLGDRIAPQSLSIANGVLTVKWLDRKSDEPFSTEPTIPTSKQFTYKNGVLVEK